MRSVIYTKLYVLYLYISTLRRMCAVTNIAVFPLFLDFMLSRYVVHVFSEWFWVPSSPPSFYRYRFVVTLHISCCSVVMFVFFRIFSACFLITFLSTRIATSIYMCVPVSLSRIYNNNNNNNNNNNGIFLPSISFLFCRFSVSFLCIFTLSALNLCSLYSL
jgi:hypothetical protein